MAGEKLMTDIYKCLACGGAMVPMRIGIKDCTGKLETTICFKQGCRGCGNSRLTDYGTILFYSIRDDGNFNFNRDQFAIPTDIPYHSKKAFIDTVLALVEAEPVSLRWNWIFSREEIREFYKSRQVTR